MPKKSAQPRFMTMDRLPLTRCFFSCPFFFLRFDRVPMDDLDSMGSDVSAAVELLRPPPCSHRVDQRSL